MCLLADVVRTRVSLIHKRFYVIDCNVRIRAEMKMKVNHVSPRCTARATWNSQVLAGAGGTTSIMYGKQGHTSCSWVIITITSCTSVIKFTDRSMAICLNPIMANRLGHCAKVLLGACLRWGALSLGG